MCYSLTLCLPLISVAYYKTYIYVGNSSCEAVCFVHPKLLSASQTSLIPQTPQVSPDHPQFYACWVFLRFHNLSFFYCYLIGIRCVETVLVPKDGGKLYFAFQQEWYTGLLRRNLAFTRITTQ